MSFPFFETFVLSLFDTLQYYVITNKLNNGKLTFKSWHFIVVFLCAICTALLSFKVEGAYAYYVNSLILMALSFFLYKRSGFQLMYLHILGTIIVLIVQLALLFPIYAVMGKIEYTFGLGLFAQITALIISVFTAKILPIHYMYRYVETKNNVFRVVTLNVFILLTFFVIYWYSDFGSVIENLILIAVLVVIILLINLIFLREGLKNHIIEEQNRAYECYLPIVNELMDEIRIKQHDFDNHITALKGVLEQRKEAETAIERVEDYIQEIETSFQNIDLLKMKNRIIAGFLYSKKKQSLEADIELIITIDDYQLETELKDYELLDILSILIDNAFETGIPDNVIQVHFYKQKNKSVIEVANKHSYIPTIDINEFFTKGYSTKSKVKRGLGLYKLKQLVANYRGDIEVVNSDRGENFIVFKVSIP